MTDKNKLKTELDENNALAPEITTKFDKPKESKLNEILNRKEFSYDVNGDALYKQYADKFKLGGRMAMMDTMGQASAMTGGYGNSYAQSVGQQTYQGYMRELNDVIPELYSLAYGMYNDEGERLLNEYNLLSDAQSEEYNKLLNDRSYNYQLERDSLEDKRYEDTAKQNERANLLTEAQIAASLGDYDKYKKLGYDIDNVANTVKYDVLTSSQKNELRELASMGIVKKEYTEDDPYYEQVIDDLLLYQKYYNIDPVLIQDLTANLIPEAYLNYMYNRDNNIELLEEVNTDVTSSYYGGGGGREFFKVIKQ